MIAITKFPNRFLHQTTIEKKPYRAWAWTVRAKNRQEALDTKSSFREGIEAPRAKTEYRGEHQKMYLNGWLIDF
jgi:hypothetical protein